MRAINFAQVIMSIRLLSKLHLLAKTSRFRRFLLVKQVSKEVTYYYLGFRAPTTARAVEPLPVSFAGSCSGLVTGGAGLRPTGARS